MVIVTTGSPRGRPSSTASVDRVIGTQPAGDRNARGENSEHSALL